MIFSAGFFGCGPSSFVTGVHYSNPLWAPVYSNGVRYYYLPDIEVYYDLSNQDFIYLENGQWLFSPVLPSFYRTYDLYNGFVVALNFNIYRPWMHHEFYVSHYPRYYYRNVYKNEDFRDLRGFNENDRKPFYWRPEDRSKINDLRKKERNQPPREFKQLPQNTNYHWKEIGKPVRVRPDMKENKRNDRENNNRQNNDKPKQ